MMRPCSDRGIFRFLAIAILIALAVTLAVALPGVSAAGDQDRITGWGEAPPIPDKTALNYPNLGSHLDQLVTRVAGGQATSKYASGDYAIEATNIALGETGSFTFTVSGLIPGSPDSDRTALLALYNATNGANWTNNEGWLTDAPIGEWHGVTTNASGRVTLVDLRDNGLSGEIPPELGSLSNLERLSLSANQLTGEIPTELGNLAGLTSLSLGDNQLTGPIRPELAQLTNLTHLSLWGNGLTGSVPAWLDILTNLEY